MPAPIYLDHQATTPLDPRVADAMRPWLGARFGNPASAHHAIGWAAEKALEAARADVADLLGADPREVVFTSGGTESDNLALLGVAGAIEGSGRHIVTTAVESRGVRDAALALGRRGFEVELLGVDDRGRVDPDALLAAVREDTLLVSVQIANHEVGTLQDVAAIGAGLAPRGVLLHADAAPAAAWLPLDVEALGVHLLSLSGHRMHGPPGIGALYVRRRRPRVRLAPLLHGGGHERGLRGGMPNVLGAVGLGRAAALCREEREQDAARAGHLRDRLEQGLLEHIPDLVVHGDRARRLPNVSSLSIPGVEGEALVLGVPSVAFATGSACSSATLEPSYVLRAMGLGKEAADTSVRFGLGRFTTQEEIDTATARIAEAVARIRAAGTPPRATP